MRALLFFCCLIALSCISVRGEEQPAGKFVGTFSNGVSVEFVGISTHPSVGKEWWQPDGAPLPTPPYSKVIAYMTPSPGGIAREACWRFHGIGERDVQTGWSTAPAYSSGANVSGNRNGTPEETLEKCAITFDEDIKTCSFRFTITTPVTDWETCLENQAGHASSIGRLHPTIGGVSAAFLRQRRDGPDTIVAVSYKVPGREVRLAAVDQDGDVHIAENGGGAGISDFTMTEFRFRNMLPEQLVTWQLQSRNRGEESIVFENVSLEPGHQTELKVVNVESAPQRALSFVPAPTPAPAPQEVSADGTYEFDGSAQFKKQQELVKHLADKQGYKLGKGELLKYLSDTDNEHRNELHRSMTQSLGGWMSGSGAQEETFEPFIMLFQADESGNPQLASTHNGVITLAEVLENVLHLKRQEFECPPGLLMSYMPGDWVLSWNPREDHKVSDAELAAFEKILNEQLDLGMKCQWKTVERPALVVSGKYEAKPKAKEPMSPEVAQRADGMFEIPARRSDIAMSVGTYKKFLQTIGEVLMLPVVDEAEVRPTKESYFWQHTGQPTPGLERLKSEAEQTVLQSLAEQTGFEFRVEPREVKVLSIQPIEE